MTNTSIPTIEEMNKVIAEFMGATFKQVDYFCNGKITSEIIFEEHPSSLINGTKRTFSNLADLIYDKSWDWLMPVVDDIYYSRRFSTGAQTGELSSRSHKLYKNIETALLHLSIEQTHKAVYEFIRWYNQTQSK